MMFNLGGIGGLGFGFTMNLGGNRDRGPNFQLGFSFLPLLIGGLIVVMTSLGDYLDYSENPIYKTTNHRSTRTTSGGTRRPSRPRYSPNPNRPSNFEVESNFLEYFFYSVYIMVIVSFVGYAVFQRNRIGTQRQ